MLLLTPTMLGYLCTRSFSALLFRQLDYAFVAGSVPLDLNHLTSSFTSSQTFTCQASLTG